MKTLLHLVQILSLILAVGCGTAPKSPQAVAYIALADTVHTVDAAMKIYGQACAAGKLDAKTQAKVDAIHDRYRIAITEAIRVAKMDLTQPTPEKVAALATEIINTLQALNL